MNNLKNNTIKINNIDYDLAGLEELAWKKLVNGSVKKKNGFRTMCVGTIGSDDSASLRIVINRKVDELQKTILFYTDIRSRKFIDLQKDNRVSLLFYDARQKIQIVVKASAEISNDNIFIENRWQTSSPQARLGYMTIEAPNTPSDNPTLGYDAKYSEIKPTEAESNLFKKNFTIFVCKVYELEFLYLDYLGNSKANFYYKNGVLDNSFWAVP